MDVLYDLYQQFDTYKASLRGDTTILKSSKAQFMKEIKLIQKKILFYLSFLNQCDSDFFWVLDASVSTFLLLY